MRSLIKFSLIASATLAPLTQASAENIVGLVGSNTIVTFDSANPGVITSSGTLTGVAAGDRLTGIDLRPSNGQLYSVGTSGAVYLITRDPSGSYTAASTGTFSPAPSGSSFGIDFNPTGPVALRHVSDTNQNLRIGVGPPATATLDSAITLNGTTIIDLVGSAYANNVPGAMTTVLYGLDSITDSLVRSTNANAGTYVNTNVNGALFLPLGAGIAFTNEDRVSFDISGATGQAFFTINENLYSVDLLSGLGTFIGALGSGGIVGIAAAPAVPEPGTWAMMLLGFGAVGWTLRRKPARKPALAI